MIKNFIYIFLLFESVHSFSMTKVGIVTGGTRGIGYGIATSLAEKKYDLLLTYNTNIVAAKEKKQYLEKKYNNRVELIGGDLALKNTRKAIFKKYDEKFKNNTHELSVVIHNAGQYIGLTSENNAKLKNNNILIFGDGSLINKNDDLNTNEMRYYQDLYGDAYIELCERAINRMNNGGSLIGISSPGCTQSYNPAIPTLKTGYDLPGSGKCIMEYAMRYIALRCGYKNINCNIIVPGAVETDGFNKMIETILTMISGKFGTIIYNNFKKKIDIIAKKAAKERYPMGISKPKELGDVVVFLCSKEGRLINGVSIPVDGGAHLKL